MGNKRGNANWVKGGKSPNPYGRPMGQSGLAFFKQDPDLFLIRRIRWERFCWGLMEPPYTGAAAARKVGYTLKSARFIASRLLRKNPVIEAILKRQQAIVELYSITGDMSYSTSGNPIEKLETIRRNRMASY